VFNYFSLSIEVFKMGVIKVQDQNGKLHVLEAVEGWRVMEIIREHGLPIKAECGGACACATCQVEVAPEWAARLHEMRDDEEDMLDSLPVVTDYSRLSCQIIYEDELDGLELRLTDAALPDDVLSQGNASKDINAEVAA